MSPTSSSAAQTLRPLGPANDTGQSPAARIVPSWQGRYLARRGRRYSDPKILRYVVGMAATAIIGAAILLSYFLLQELKQSDILRAEIVSMESSAAVEDVFSDATITLRHVASVLNTPAGEDGSFSPEILRQRRRDVSATLTNSPVAGLVLIDALGTAVFEIGDIQRANMTRWAKLPLEPGARLLETEIAFLAAETDQGVQALIELPDSNHAIIAVIDQRLLQEALTPRTETMSGVYLYDEAGRILAASPTIAAPARINSGFRPQNLFESDHRNRARVSTQRAAMSDSQAVSRTLNAPGLQILATSPPLTTKRFFAENGHLLTAGWGLAVLVVSLLVYVIQTEWNKQDRRVSLDEDVVARSEIAADIMGAGIIDWRISDAVISYSEGWQRLFSDGSPIVDEEIFDWIDKLHPDYRTSARENYQALLEGRVLEVEHEIKVRHRDGNYILVHERGRARANAIGEATRIVLVQRRTREG